MDFLVQLNLVSLSIVCKRCIELIDILFSLFGIQRRDDLSTAAGETKGCEMLPCFSLAIINLATSQCENRAKIKSRK